MVKQILGEKVWRDWNLAYPENPMKQQRWFSEDEMFQMVRAASGQWRVMFAVLASFGLRAGEAFGLHVEDLDLDAGRIYVRRSVWNGEEVSVKTKNGYRVVNIDPQLVAMLRTHVGKRTTGRVFQTRRGTPHSKSNVRRKLNQILKKLGLPPAGLHAFRHGRVSILRANSVPDDLVKEWVGHSSLRATSRYTHFKDDFRTQTAREVALFSEEKPLDGPNGPNFVENSASGDQP